MHRPTSNKISRNLPDPAVLFHHKFIVSWLTPGQILYDACWDQKVFTTEKPEIKQTSHEDGHDSTADLKQGKVESISVKRNFALSFFLPLLFCLWNLSG
jgi:hypothetical protein